MPVALRSRRGSMFLLWFATLGLLIVGTAGPRWGEGSREGVAVGRDLILVIDLSRSMQAADLKEAKPRWKAAVEAAEATVQAASRRGGHRVGIILFAARPHLLVPLTTDYAHALQMLDEIDGNARPPQIRPDESAVSGTRIGAAVQLAIASHDARYPGVQDVILFSDGDDPAEDREWTAGIAPARRAGIPVHTVGIGGTDATPLLLPKKGDAEGELISTKLHPEVLDGIARETRGTGIPAGRHAPAMEDFFVRNLEPLPTRRFSDDAPIARKDRSAAFLAGGLVGFVILWWRRPL
jgi:Ca-activated chloride channel family protein